MVEAIAKMCEYHSGNGQDYSEKRWFRAIEHKLNSFDIDLMDNGKIYAFEYQNKTYIRRLFFGNSNTFTIVTDSISMPQKPITVSFNEIKIIGQCINAIIEI